MDALPDGPLAADPMPAATPLPAAPPAAAFVPLGETPKFVTGSLLHHILVMTGAGGIGLCAIFLGDLANIAFLSWLNDQAIVAAAGYASSIMFLTVSIGIGVSIAASALVSPALGARDRDNARRLSVNAHLAAAAISALLAVVIWLASPWFLRLLGADGRTYDLALGYLHILVPSTPMLALAITSAAVLRAAGDARRAMNVTLWGAVANAVLDPLLIFGLHLGIEGAAMATFVARTVFMGVGLYGVIRVHGLMSRPQWPLFKADVPNMMGIAVPAILTNVATPASNAYVTAAMAAHGDGAVAGWAILGRITPVAFGVIYALSGSIGPIIGQNFGAGDRDRMLRAFTLALAVNAGYTLLAWVVLAGVATQLTALLHASGDAAALVHLFCWWLAPLFAFLGAMFVANAAFNTLGHPHIPTVLNWGRATLGTIPLVHLGGAVAGAGGVLAGQMLGGILFGLAAVLLCYRLIGKVALNHGPARQDNI